MIYDFQHTDMILEIIKKQKLENHNPKLLSGNLILKVALWSAETHAFLIKVTINLQLFLKDAFLQIQEERISSTFTISYFGFQIKNQQENPTKLSKFCELSMQESKECTVAYVFA